MSTLTQSTPNVLVDQMDDPMDAMDALEAELNQDIGWTDDPHPQVINPVVDDEKSAETIADEKKANACFESLNRDRIRELQSIFSILSVNRNGEPINSCTDDIRGLKFLAGNSNEFLEFMDAYEVRKTKYLHENDDTTEEEKQAIDAMNDKIKLGRKLYIGIKAMECMDKYKEYTEQNMESMKEMIKTCEVELAKAEADINKYKGDDDNKVELQKAKLRATHYSRKIRNYTRMLTDDPAETDKKNQPSEKMAKVESAQKYLAKHFPDYGTYNKMWCDVHKRINGIDGMGPATGPLAAKPFRDRAREARERAREAEERANSLLPKDNDDYNRIVREYNAYKQAGGVRDLIMAEQKEREMRRYWSEAYLMAQRDLYEANRLASDLTARANEIDPPKRKPPVEKVEEEFFDNEGVQWRFKCLRDASTWFNKSGKVWGDIVHKMVRPRDPVFGPEPKPAKRPKTDQEVSDEAHEALVKEHVRPGVIAMREAIMKRQAKDAETLAQMARLERANRAAREAAAKEEAEVNARYGELKQAKMNTEAAQAAINGPCAMFLQQISEDSAEMAERARAMSEATKGKRTRDARSKELQSIITHEDSLARMLDNPAVSGPSNYAQDMDLVAAFESEDSQASNKPIKNLQKAKAK